MALSAQTSALLDEVLAHFGVENATIHDIRTGRVNKHWRVEAGSDTYALRRYTPQRSISAINYEHDILRYMAARGWPVAAPLLGVDGTQTLVHVGGRTYWLFPFLPGSPAPQNAHYARAKGRLLARLHQDLASWEAPGQRDGFGRVWELDTYVAAQSRFASLSELLLAFGQQHTDLARTVRAQKYAMLRELSTLGYGELPAVPCHFDFHRDNLLFQRGALSGLLDFDLAHLDARVADVASSIFLDCYAPPAYSEISPRLAAQFVAGYVEHAPLSDAELQLIVPLIRAAILGLVVWRLTRWARRDEPEYALRSIQRSVETRFPSFARTRSELEAAILQAGGW
jgi:homoserine kinase type II